MTKSPDAPQEVVAAGADVDVVEDGGGGTGDSVTGSVE